VFTGVFEWRWCVMRIRGVDIVSLMFVGISGQNSVRV